MKPDKDTFLTNMNTVELDGKKVLVWPSQSESTKGKEIVIGEERQLGMIRPKNPKIGRWKKNERNKSRSHPKATSNILMAKYKDGRAGTRVHKNWTIRFPWVKSVLLWQEPRSTNSLGHHHGEIQKVGIVIDRCIS
jgi:hypothetical protein